MIIRKGEFAALIPARGGSKGVPRKNIKNLGGFPLIAYSIAACKMCGSISRVIVSTDDDEIAEIALRYGAEVPFRRPKEEARDTSPDYGFVKHAIDWFAQNENGIPEYLVHMRPTTPLRDPDIVEEALELFGNSKNFTSLRSAHLAPESPYKWFLRADNNTFRSILDDIDNESANNGRANFPDTYIPDGYVDILRTEFVVNNGKLHGEMMLAFESPPCTEVDTIEEFEYLEYQINKKGSTIQKYLCDKYKKEIY